MGQEASGRRDDGREAPAEAGTAVDAGGAAQEVGGTDASGSMDGGGGTGDGAMADAAADATAGSDGGLDTLQPDRASDGQAATDGPLETSATGTDAKPADEPVSQLADAADLAGPPDLGPDLAVPDLAPDKPVTPDASPDVFLPADQSGQPDLTDAAPPPAGGYLTVVAHPDDDILFFNPDLESFMRQGVPASIVYITSGDQSEQERGWQARELGILDAQAAMGGLSTACLAQAADPTAPCAWSCGAASYLAHTVRRCTLQSFTAIFMRLPDGQIGRLWGSLAEPDLPPVSSVTQIPGAGSSSSYGKQDLTDVLASIMAQLRPTQILAMDSTMAYNTTQGTGTYDHSDHIGAGFFTLTAAQAYHAFNLFRIYRGYTVLSDPPNVNGAAYDEKVRLMEIYGPGSATGYADYLHRQISYGSRTGSGGLKSGGQCLQHAGATTAVAACNSSPAQAWTLGNDATLTADNGQCFTTDDSGSPLTLASCAGAIEQRWVWFENGQLRGLMGGCLTSASGSITLADCDGMPSGAPGVDPAQQWLRP